MVVCFQMPGCWVFCNVPTVGRVRAWSSVIAFVTTTTTTTTTTTIGFRILFCGGCLNDTNITNAQRAKQAISTNRSNDERRH